MCNTDRSSPGTQARIVSDQEENLPETLPLYGRERQTGTDATCVWALDWNVLPEKKKNKAWMFLFFFLAISTVCHTKLKGLRHKS